MSGGGRLVVLDRAGRAGKSFAVPSGAATLGRGLHCDVRVLLPHVSRHHATIIVHAVQAVIRNECEGETLVNGRSVSVAALQHGDVVTLGGRRLRWEYADPAARRPLSAQPALYPHASAAARGRAARARSGRASAGAGAEAGAAAQLALHLKHRASMPGNAGGKQVAIVQPQRRDTSQQSNGASPRVSSSPRQGGGARPRGSAGEPREEPAPALRRDSPRPRHTTMSPRSLALLNTTKATLWIESRKSAPPAAAPAPLAAPRRAASARKRTPLLRVAVLRKAQSAHKLKVTKIEAPLKMDQTKQAAIMLMTGHTAKLKGLSPKQTSAKRSPTFLVKKPSLVQKTPRSGGRKSAGRSKISPTVGVTGRGSGYGDTSVSKRSAGQSLSVLEITDSDSRRSTFGASSSKLRKTSTIQSPLPPSPKKSSLKDPLSKSMRKTESIKFDLSNLENYSQNQSNDVFLITANTVLGDSVSEDDVTLHYDTSSTKSPSPRRSIHSRSSRSLGTISESRSSQQSFTSAESPRAKKSLRGSTMLSTVADDSHTGNYTAHSRRSTKTVTDQSRISTVTSKTRTLSPRASNQNLESYSIVDLVSIDTNESARSESVYDSAGSTRSSSIVFGTPQSTSVRKTRSTIGPNLLGSSTPYVGGAGTPTRSHSSPNISARTSSPNKSAQTSASRRSKSLTTPENTQKHISVNSTRISRASRSRSRINDSDLQYISGLDDEADESPKSSRRGTRTDKSQNITNISASNKSLTPNKTFTKSPRKDRTMTPEHKNVSIVERSPVLSVRRLLDSTRSSRTSQQSQKRVPTNIKRKTIGVIQSERKGRSSAKSKSLNISKRKLSNSLKLSKDLTESPSILNISPQNERRSSGRKTTIADSPRSDRRSSRQHLSLNTSIADSPQSKRKSSRKNLTLNITAATNSQNEGTITPESINSPEEVGTPILSIQSLLNSSQSSLASQRLQNKRVSANVKRRTVGVIRPERKGRSSLQSKSLNISKRKSTRPLRMTKDPSVESDATDENAPQPDNEDTVTPKSAVKIVHEAVKNKHSTAKKPQSKRSLIDNLNDSDIIKHLFNSPVKRKLSQSMTEFSRKRLFGDDEDVLPKRPTRNTVALSGRTPDNSLLLDHTENITPEKFVSPLSTPSHSPSLTGIKRLYRKNTPENDLRNIKGVKGLLKTPRPRRSVRNDLTNVSGVKKVFAKSPKNRLSDVRVKEIFTEGPKNDLRRVSGVKSLFQSQVAAKNDLSDVRGIKNLFTRKSTVNDLRNVSGVKKTLQARSPKNDLTDVRGVRRMFRQEKQRTDLDVSGIEELFNESDNSYRDPDKLFDRLVGKPPIKAVYSKWLLSKSSQKQTKLRKAKSLEIPIETITDTPEKWIEQELKKHLHKDYAAKAKASASKARKSLNKSSAFKANVTRELQKLATDTVEGDAPILTSRERNSTIGKSRAETTQMKKSASELYSAHKLPLKKRSLVDRSRSTLEKSKSTLLPLKKRTVVHSTPVKGRFYDSTMNASELGRVSPIAVVEKTQNLENDTTIRSTQILTKKSPKSKGKDKSTLVNQEIAIEVQSETSQRPRGRRAVNTKAMHENQEPLPKAKGRRDTKANVEKQGTEFKTKSLRSTAKSTRDKETSVETAPKSRRTRNNIERNAFEAKASPKQRGARAKPKAVQNEEQKIQVKPSPKPTRTAKALALSVLGDKTTRTRRTVDSTKVANARKRRQSLVITKKPPVMSPNPEAKATRKAQKASPLTTSPKATSTRRQKSEKSVVKVTSPRSRARVAVVVINRMSPKFKPKVTAAEKATSKVKSPAAAPSTRAKANDNIEKKNKTKSPKKSQGAESKRTRKTVVETEVVTEPQAKRSRRTRGINNEAEKPASEPQNTVEQTRKGRKRKLVDDQTVMPSKVTKSEVTKATRGRPKSQTVASPKATRSGITISTRGKTNDKKVISPKTSKNEVTKATRRMKDQTIESPKTTRNLITKSIRGRPKDQDVASPKMTKSEVPKPTRGRSTIASPTIVPKATRSKSKGKAVASPKATAAEGTKSTRRNRKDQTVASPNTKADKKSSRGKKTAIELTAVETKTRKSQEETAPVRGRKAAAAVQSSPQTGRKRKTSPAKAGPAKKARRGAPKASASPVKEPPARGRSTRAKAIDVSVAAARGSARSRRR